jgi:hypothetical protein
VAATPLTVHTITEANPLGPVTETAADATNGNSVQNGPAMWLEMTNGGGSAATVEVAYAQPVDGQTVPPRTYSLGASAQLRAGSFNEQLFGRTLSITASAATVTLAAYQLG